MLRKLLCRWLGHKWAYCTVIQFFGNPEIETHTYCTRCRANKEASDERG